MRERVVLLLVHISDALRRWAGCAEHRVAVIRCSSPRCVNSLYAPQWRARTSWICPALARGENTVSWEPTLPEVAERAGWEGAGDGRWSCGHCVVPTQWRPWSEAN